MSKKPAQNSTTEHETPSTASPKTPWNLVAFAAILCFLIFGFVHIAVTPVLAPASGSLINAPDEPAHLGYIDYLRTARKLPTRRDNGGSYEWHQPPLYYAIGSIFSIAGPKGVRVFSLLCGALTLLVLFGAIRSNFPGEEGVVALAVCFAALLPMRQAVMGAVGNDSLIEFLFTLSLAFCLRVARMGFTRRHMIRAGVVIGLALLTKASAMLLLPIVVAAAWYAPENQDDSIRRWKGALGVFAIALVIASPWFLRNFALYQEITPMKAFVREFEHTAKADDFVGKQPLAVDMMSGDLVPGELMDRGGYLTLVANWSARTFCAAYTPLKFAGIGRPFFLPAPFYLLFGSGVVVAFIGLIRLHFARKERFTPAQQSVILLCFGLLGLVSLGFAGFIWTYFQGQGRYLYPAILPIALLFALGFRGALPERYRDLGSGLYIGVLALLSFAFLFTGVLPAYT